MDMASSQYDELYATATGTSFKDIMHSTPLAGSPARQEMPLHYDQFPEPSEHGSESMSIEIGRGGQRGASKNYDDISSNVTFTFGNEHSQYEITGTPPVRPRNNQRRSDTILRKEASVRRATESGRMRNVMRPVTSTTKPRAVSDNHPRLDIEDDVQEPSLHTATFAIRGSRFTSSRHVSRSYSGIPSRFTPNEGLVANGQTPMRSAAGNATVQSATHTANQSFMLPDLPNLTELVSGVRTDGTPMLKRTGVSRSRFTSTSYKPQHIPVSGIPLPEEEKAIFASLQLANGRITQLELEKTERQQYAEELERELLELRDRLNTAKERDSAICSDEESVELKTSRHETTRLKTKVKALQNRLDKTDRKVSNSEITLSRVSRERNTLVAEIGSAYYQIEELAKENDELKAEIERLRSEDAEHHRKPASRSKSQIQDRNPTQQLKRSRSMSRPVADAALDEPNGKETSKTRRDKANSERKVEEEENIVETDDGSDEDYDGSGTNDQLDQASARDLAARIEQEVQKHREKAATRVQQSGAPAPLNSLQSRRRSQQRMSSTQHQQTNLRRQSSAPTEVVAAGAVTRTHSSKANRDQEDLTVLSDLDADAVADLRKKLETELMTSRSKRASVPPGVTDVELTSSSNRPAVPRKSSLKDINTGLREDTGRSSVHDAITDDFIKASKTVRVQSPHSSQDILDTEGQDTTTGDASVLSNMSRRRRRTSSIEGMTSAFIIPDITMHSTHATKGESSHGCIAHKADSCTVCAASRGKSVEIPAPIPVSERLELADMTDATVRPAQTPVAALATVIKNLEDEIKHLKLARDRQNCLYNQHEPAVSKRRRQSIHLKIQQLTDNIELRSDQVYQLYDVLEGQKQQGKEQEVEETLTSVGIDPAELSGRVGRSGPAALDDIEGMSGDESDELPWEGLSEVESEDVGVFGK